MRPTFAGGLGGSENHGDKAPDKAATAIAFADYVAELAQTSGLDRRVALTESIAQLRLWSEAAGRLKAADALQALRSEYFASIAAWTPEARPVIDKMFNELSGHIHSADLKPSQD